MLSLKLARGVYCVAFSIIVLGISEKLAFAQGVDCCVDLEERVAELEAATVRKKRSELEITIGGAVDRALMLWNDGGERKVYAVENPLDATTFEIVGEAELEGGWKIEFGTDFDFAATGMDRVSQLNNIGNILPHFLEPSDSFIAVENERLGRILLGKTDTFTDGVDNINLADADVLVSADANDWLDSFFLRATGISGFSGLATGLPGAYNDGFGELLWGDYTLGAITGDTVENVTYSTPEVRGFIAGASWGNIDKGTDIWDGGIYYANIWGDQLQIQAGFGYGELVPDDPNAEERLDARFWGTGVAVKHLPTGLNFAFNYGNRKNTGHCEEPGAISEMCPDTNDFYYAVGGLVRKFSDRGRTSFYVDYFRSQTGLNDSDEDQLRSLEAIPDSAEELRNATVTAWGFGVVQYFDAASMALYLGYKHFDIDFDLVNADGAVPARAFEDFGVILSGAVVKF